MKVRTKKKVDYLKFSFFAFILIIIKDTTSTSSDEAKQLSADGTPSKKVPRSMAEMYQLLPSFLLFPFLSLGQI